MQRRRVLIMTDNHEKPGQEPDEHSPRVCRDLTEGLKYLQEAIRSGKQNELPFVLSPQLFSLDDYLSLVLCIRDFVRASVRGTDIQQLPMLIKPLENQTYTRKEVYDCVSKYAQKNAGEIVGKFETRFQRGEWGEELPFIGINDILLKEHLDDLCIPRYT